MTYATRLSFLFASGVVIASASCGDDDPAEPAGEAPLTIAFEGRVADESLRLGSVTYAAATAPEGFRPTRVSFYLSGVELLTASGEAVPVAEVAYVEFDPAGAAQLTFDGVPVGSYEELRFRVGLSEAQDATTPADYATDHPLGRASEYWVDWGSYIFLKLEGRSDTLADGRERFDAAYTYHVGRSAELARTVTLPISIEVGPGAEEQSIGLDLAALLGLGEVDELPVVGVADHRNGAAERIMDNVEGAFTPRS